MAEANDAADAQARNERINPSRQPVPDQQDLGVSRLREPDQGWRQRQPIAIAPSRSRLDAAHQLVRVRNDSDVERATFMGPRPQTHIVLDRFMNGHELRAGETKEVDMLECDVEYFLTMRAPGRADNLGRPTPRHPLRFVDIDEDRWHREHADELRRTRWSKQRPREAEDDDNVAKRRSQASREAALYAQQWPTTHPMRPERDERDFALERQHDWRNAGQPSQEEVEKRDQERASRDHDDQRRLEDQAGINHDRRDNRSSGQSSGQGNKNDEPKGRNDGGKAESGSKTPAKG